MEEKNAEQKKMEEKKEAAAKTTVAKPAVEKTVAVKTAVARIKEARISPKHSVVLCNAIRGKNVEKAQMLLSDLAIGKRDLDGKHYTKASEKLIGMLNEARANATEKGMDASKLFIAVARSSRGRTFMRPRTRGKLSSTQIKSTNMEIVLEER